MSTTISYPAELPVSARREDIMAAIAANQVTIVAGETGSGKTTQIPKMCLELGLAETGLIGHTQPRRLAARTVAERIAAEMGCELGTDIGYQVRFTGKVGKDTRVKLMTDGILLAEIQHDKLLSRYSTIIIDEAHERSLNIDFILGYLRRILDQRPDLKVIITSATIDPERFAEHFAGRDGTAAPIIEVSGRTYPVEMRYRPLSQPASGRETASDDGPDDEDDLEEDRDPLDAVCDAVEELAAEPPGDILIFFPGEREIRDAAEALRARLARNRRLASAQILPLYARLSLAEQRRVFSPGGATRIVLATNVAETSLTVPGIKYVVDTGTARISRYSHRTKVQRLPIERVSQASANQRAGRCGRVSDGICIRLYSQEDFEARREFTDPEILRTNLASVILQMTAMGVASGPKDIASFEFVEPPDAKAIADGVALLRELGALTESQGTKSKGAKSQAARSEGAKAKGSGGKTTRLTDVGRQIATLPLDPRLARMIVEAARRDCAREVMVLAAALTIQDPRERPPADAGSKRAQAAEKHKRFADEHSDFTGYLNLWRYLQQKQEELSSSQFRKLCRNEFLNYLRVREWQDLFTQLRHLSKSQGIKLSGPHEVDPVGKHTDIHVSLLSGLLSHIGLYDQRKREYAGARGTRFAIFPGSALFKKSPDAVMAAELVETSRLWARVAAKIDPAWVEQVAPNLVKHTYSEPHWSRKQGAVMAHEKVTLYGVPVVASRRIHYGRIEPELCRDLFIRHALVEGDWRTHHQFFHRNQQRLADVDELENRMRRRDLRVDDETLFDFYDARIGADVVSERHFDKWWKHARHENPQLLDFDPEALVAEDVDELDQADFPSQWDPDGLGLDLDYQFAPATGSDSPSERPDGVTVVVPVLLMNQLDPAGFRWQIPGLRVELVTALIKSMPKAVRKNFVPAPDVARAAAAVLAADFAPSADRLEPSLGLALRRLKGHVVEPGSFNWEAVPDHLRMNFRVVDDAGRTLGEGRDLRALQTELAGANRRAIAASLTTTPTSTAKASGTGSSSGSATGPAKNSRKNGRSPDGHHTPGHPPGSPAGSSAGHGGGEATSSSPESGLSERGGLTSWTVGTIPTSVDRTVSGHRITGYPALVDEGTTVALRVLPAAAGQEAAMRGGVIRLLALRVPSPAKYVLEHLSNTERLTFSANPHGSVSALIEDCTIAAIDRLTPTEPPWDEAGFDVLYERVRAELIDAVFDVTAIVEKVLASARRIEKTLKSSSSLALVGALNDIKAQLGRLVYPGFVARTGYAQLRSLPRYLAAVEQRLEKLPTTVQRDGLNMAVVQRLESEYEAALASPATDSATAAALHQVRWMLEELRVSFFAQGLPTAYTVSEKRVRKALAQALQPAG